MAKVEDMCNNKTYNYKQKHQDLKDRMKTLNKEYMDLMGVLDTFNGQHDKPINKDDLMKFPLLEWVDLNDKISIRRRKMLFGDHINSDTILKKNGEFGKHFHEDVIESTEVLSGKILDKNNGDVYLANDVMHYEKGQHHTPVALEDSVLKVIFKP